MVDNSVAAVDSAPAFGLFPWDRPRVAQADIDLVLVQDDSWSMCRTDGAGSGATRLEAVRRVVSLLDVNARVAFVAFGARDRGRVISLRGIASQPDREAMVATIEAATFEKGASDYGEALRSVIDALVEGDVAYGWPPYQLPGRTAGALFLSDGWLPDRHQLRELRDIYQRLRERRLPVFTVGMGSAVREPGAGGRHHPIGAPPGGGPTPPACAPATGGRAYLASGPQAVVEACDAVVAELSGRGWTASFAGMTAEHRQTTSLLPMGRSCTA
jgi:hypothetical protein